MKIEMGKKYRSINGEFTAEALCVDLTHSLPVAMKCTNKDGSQVIRQYAINGDYYVTGELSHFNLTEVTPYDHIKKGDVVLAWDGLEKHKYIRIFSHYEDYKIHTFSFIKIDEDEYRIVLNYLDNHDDKDKQLICIHTKESFIDLRDCMTRLLESNY